MSIRSGLDKLVGGLIPSKKSILALGLTAAGALTSTQALAGNTVVPHNPENWNKLVEYVDTKRNTTNEEDTNLYENVRECVEKGVEPLNFVTEPETGKCYGSITVDSDSGEVEVSLLQAGRAGMVKPIDVYDPADSDELLPASELGIEFPEAKVDVEGSLPVAVPIIIPEKETETGPKLLTYIAPNGKEMPLEGAEAPKGTQGYLSKVNTAVATGLAEGLETTEARTEFMKDNGYQVLPSGTLVGNGTNLVAVFNHGLGLVKKEDCKDVRLEQLCVDNDANHLITAGDNNTTDYAGKIVLRDAPVIDNAKYSYGALIGFLEGTQVDPSGLYGAWIGREIPVEFNGRKLQLKGTFGVYHGGADMNPHITGQSSELGGIYERTTTEHGDREVTGGMLVGSLSVPLLNELSVEGGLGFDVGTVTRTRELRTRQVRDKDTQYEQVRNIVEPLQDVNFARGGVVLSGGVVYRHQGANPKFPAPVCVGLNAFVSVGKFPVGGGYLSIGLCEPGENKK